MSQRTLEIHALYTFQAGNTLLTLTPILYTESFRSTQHAVVTFEQRVPGS